jgi:hypothetical protein
MGYKCQVGNGKKNLFWEDTWIGNCSLSILFWDLYIIVNEQQSTLAQVWDGTNLKMTFRRTVNQVLFDR